ncbi:glycine receptor subunit alphaZ1-like [Saccoglossus kowalevskii]
MGGGLGRWEVVNQVDDRFWIRKVRGCESSRWHVVDRGATRWWIRKVRGGGFGREDQLNQVIYESDIRHYQHRCYLPNLQRCEINMAAITMHVVSCSEVHYDNATENLNMSHVSLFIEELFINYDRRLTPTFSEETPTTVICDVFVSNIGSISESTMNWFDHRLRHPQNRKIPTSSALLERIWVPDLFFANEKEGIQHQLTVENKLLRVSHDGEVILSQRLSLRLNCNMHLQHFPMDEQVCDMAMESFGYTSDQLIFIWRNDMAKAVQVDDTLTLPQFELYHTNTKRCDKVYWTGNFTCIAVSFHFVRQIGYYMLNTYIPTFALVLLSWVSFWMRPDAAPARVSLGVTVILTTTTLAIGVRGSFAKVSYITAIDVWMTSCLIFVISTTIEFAIVNFLYHICKGIPSKRQPCASHANRRRSMAHYSCGESNGVGTGSIFSQSNEVRRRSDGFAETRLMTKLPEEKQNDDKVASNQHLALRVDNISKLLFPISFALFNLVYWATFFV